jgi:hypothetical protein
MPGSNPNSNEDTGAGRPRRFPAATVNRADQHSTDVEIFRWADGSVWADVRTGLTGIAHSLLRLQDFARPSRYVLPHSYEMDDRLTEVELRRRVSLAAEDLARQGYAVNVDPDLYTDTVLPPSLAEARRQQAATSTSPAADHAPEDGTCAPAPLPPTTQGPTTIRRTR